jgi:DNA-binding transcriptional LysR family regulator
MDFSLDQLLALDAIVRTGSFAAAATELHKVPSAISYNIQGLEAALGVDVFDRTRRKSVLTREGQRLLEASREVLDRARNLDRVASELRAGWEPQLHVVVDGALPMQPVIRCVRHFANPEIPTCLRVDIEYQDGVTARFNQAPADLALTLGFDGDGDEVGYDCLPMDELELILAAAPQHPLSKGAFTVETRAAHAELVVRDSSPRFALQPKRSFIGSRNVVFLSDFHSKRIALLEAAGYGWIPRHFIESDLSEGRLQQLETETNAWTYYPQIVTREGERPGRAGKLFLEMLQSGSTE